MVRVVPYRREWKSGFVDERKRLKKALGALALDIQHIGSTAVAGLAAKPIIDIGVAVRSLKDVRRCIEPLKKLDYRYGGQAGIPHQRIFVKGPERRRTHFLHFVELRRTGWKDYLLYRDILSSNAEVRDNYAGLKFALWKKFPKDRLLYTRGKSRFIRATLRRARQALEVQ